MHSGGELWRGSGHVERVGGKSLFSSLPPRQAALLRIVGMGSAVVVCVILNLKDILVGAGALRFMFRICVKFQINRKILV